MRYNFWLESNAHSRSRVADRHSSTGHREDTEGVTTWHCALWRTMNAARVRLQCQCLQMAAGNVSNSCWKRLGKRAVFMRIASKDRQELTTSATSWLVTVHHEYCTLCVDPARYRFCKSKSLSVVAQVDAYIVCLLVG